MAFRVAVIFRATTTLQTEPDERLLRRLGRNETRPVNSEQQCFGEIGEEQSAVKADTITSVHRSRIRLICPSTSEASLKVNANQY